MGTEVEKKTMQKKWVTQTRTVQVKNPNKGKGRKKKQTHKKQKVKKKKTPPPLPADDTADAFASLGDDNWGNDFAFDSPGTEQPAPAPPKETPGGGGGETDDGADQNWNAFGAFFDQ